MKAQSSPPLLRTPAIRFRSEIERAEADGIPREDMTLRLTLSDVHKLKRDPDLAVADISFGDGVMRFLGVRIEEGGIAESALDRPGPG
jgi:hypothetical protein